MATNKASKVLAKAAKSLPAKSNGKSRVELPVKAAPSKLTKAEAKKQLFARRDVIRAGFHDERQAEFELGHAWAEIVDLGLAPLAGYLSATDFATRELVGVAESSLRRYAIVARSFKKEIVDEYGFARLQALLTLHHLAPFHPLLADPGPLVLPHTDLGKKPKTFAKATETELTTCIRTLKEAHGQWPIAASPETAAEVGRLQVALNKTLGANSPARFTSHVQHHEVMLDIVQIPFADLKKVLEALLKA